MALVISLFLTEGVAHEHEPTRRDILRTTLAVAGMSALGIPDWVLPALAQGETLVPFTDLPTPSRVDGRSTAVRRAKIDGPFTPRDQFFTTQHYGHPDVDPAAFRLKITGLVDRPASISLDALKKMKSTELVFGFECSGNRRPFQGLASNAKWTGVPLKTVLDQAGVKPHGA
jgi:DMSO/TMAO reductase YedYZ molybdopterin-dependent catalytic subunit